MITRAMPSLNITSTNVVPLSSINMAISIMGVVFILIGIVGVVAYWLSWMNAKKEIV